MALDLTVDQALSTGAQQIEIDHVATPIALDAKAFIVGNANTGAGGFTSITMYVSQPSGGFGVIQAIKSSGSEWGNLILNPNNGNVGIGTASPASTLDVNGTITAKGLAVNGPMTLPGANLTVKDLPVMPSNPPAGQFADLAVDTTTGQLYRQH